MNSTKIKIKDEEKVVVQIPAPSFETAEFRLIGTAPLVQNKFSQKAREAIKRTQEEGQRGKKGKPKTAKNFLECYKLSQHIAQEGWNGIPASAFRAAFVSACRIVGFKMTHAKLGVFIVADGLDVDEGTPLVRITKGNPFQHEGYVRNETGVVDLRARAMWKEWEVRLKVRFDADMFSLQDVTNLLLRVGAQVGIGEGRPDSKKSAGCGWGTFRVAQPNEA